MTELRVLNEVAARAIYALTFTIPVSKLVKEVVEKGSLEKAEKEQHENSSSKALFNNSFKAQKELLSHEM